METFTLTITITNETDGPTLNMKSKADKVKTIEMAALCKMFKNLTEGSLTSNFEMSHEFSQVAKKLTECDCDDD